MSFRQQQTIKQDTYMQASTDDSFGEADKATPSPRPTVGPASMRSVLGSYWDEGSVSSRLEQKQEVTPSQRREAMAVYGQAAS